MLRDLVGSPHVAYLQAPASGYLTPFALWTAFPPADYYEVSVALGPSKDSYPVGDLAFHDHVTYRARFRSPTHPVKRVHVPECCTGRSCRPPDAYGRHPVHAASEPT